MRLNLKQIFLSTHLELLITSWETSLKSKIGRLFKNYYSSFMQNKTKGKEINRHKNNIR